jgi:hypothetical protein
MAAAINATIASAKSILFICEKRFEALDFSALPFIHLIRKWHSRRASRFWNTTADYVDYPDAHFVWRLCQAPDRRFAFVELIRGQLSDQ